MSNTETVYVRLPEEGNSARPTQAVSLGKNLFKLLPTPNYDPEDEVWEFKPGTIVNCKETQGNTGKILLAVENAS